MFEYFCRRGLHIWVQVLFNPRFFLQKGEPNQISLEHAGIVYFLYFSSVYYVFLQLICCISLVYFLYFSSVFPEFLQCICCISLVYSLYFSSVFPEWYSLSLYLAVRPNWQQMVQLGVVQCYTTLHLVLHYTSPSVTLHYIAPTSCT